MKTSKTTLVDWGYDAPHAAAPAPKAKKVAVKDLASGERHELDAASLCLPVRAAAESALSARPDGADLEDADVVCSVADWARVFPGRHAYVASAMPADPDGARVVWWISALASR